MASFDVESEFNKLFRFEITRLAVDAVNETIEENLDAAVREATEVIKEVGEDFLYNLSTDGLHGAFRGYTIDVRRVSGPKRRVSDTGGFTIKVPRIQVRVEGPTPSTAQNPTGSINLFDLLDAGREDYLVRKTQVIPPSRQYGDQRRLTRPRSLETDTPVGPEPNAKNIVIKAGKKLGGIEARGWYRELANELEDEVSRRLGIDIEIEVVPIRN